MTTAHELKGALLSHGGIDGVRVVSMDTIRKVPVVDNSGKIPAISKLDNFAFGADRTSTTAWREYGIGSGKEITLETSLPGKYTRLGHAVCL